MAAVILPLLTNPKFWGAMAVSILLGALVVQSSRLDHAKHDLAAARAALIDPATKQTWRSEEAADRINLATARQNVQTESAALAAQKRAVAALKAQGDADTAKATRAAQAARAQTAGARAEVTRVLAATAGPNPCASADALILEGLTPATSKAAR